MSNEHTIRRIERRWEHERKVSAADVDWLLVQARRADTLAAAGRLSEVMDAATRKGASMSDPFSDFFGVES